MPRESARIVGAVSGAGASAHVLVATPVRKERLRKSKKELEEEAAKVLHQADRVDCIAATNGVTPEKFYTLPTRKKIKDYESASLDRRSNRRLSLELQTPKKPPRTFATISSPQTSQKASIFEIFKKDKKLPQTSAKKSNLRRSVSDASSVKSRVASANGQTFRKRSGSDAEEFANRRNKKKQLSPIIELTQREDYFEPKNQGDKENVNTQANIVKAPVRKKKKESITEKLKQFIDEVDEEIYKETGVRPSPPPKEEPNQPTPIIIDVDKAEKISGKHKKFKDTRIAKKLKSITHKKNKANDASKLKKLPTSKIKEATPLTKKEKVIVNSKVEQDPPISSREPLIQAAIDSLENSKNSPIMIHSSQKPVEKLPLTRGRTVDSMVKRLSSDSCSSPPPLNSNVMVTPQGSSQHNNNQPFSYTRGLSPDKYVSNEHLPNPSSPIIYAQVICGSNPAGPPKQTVHTTYTNGKKHPHSDSDEGLGGEENSSGFRRPNCQPTLTHFGDSNRNDFFDEVDKFEEEESPIMPKFRNPAYMNGYSSNYEQKDFVRLDQNGFIDLSSRGRGDGMDAKRRESLTEQIEHNIVVNSNGRSDLSARRDLLESRINRRLNDNNFRTSPEYKTNVYVSESTSKCYRGGNNAKPVGYTEKYVLETRPDKYGQPKTVESTTKQYFGEHKDSTSNRIKNSSYEYNNFENEPKSFDSQISDYRSSPENNNRHFEHTKKYENKLLVKDRNLYKSTPDIHLKSYQDTKYNNDPYHDSLRSEKNIGSNITSSSKYRSERFLDDHERKDKFGDSGIENDFRRDSGDNYRVSRPSRAIRDYCNDSEDEGFASSLLIASERQHTEDSINQRKKRDYDSDRTYSREDDPYRHLESMEYKSRFRSNDYVPRERSIDDGSHYDPRIDKDVDRSTLKRVEKKPPKPEKKSSLEKVKSLFTSKKKKEKALLAPEETLRSRYVEYKGRDPVESKYKRKEVNGVRSAYSNGSRRRLSSTSNSPSRELAFENGKTAEDQQTHGSWFKSLDRLTRRKSKKDEGNITSGTEEETPSPSKAPTKNLRFFGDTDIESNDSLRYKASAKGRLTGGTSARSQSTRDLHNISEELRSNSTDLSSSRRRSSHKSMTNITESDRDVRGSRSSLKPPMSPVRRGQREAVNTATAVTRPERSRRRKNEVSSVESSTEGDSSQQSQRSIVYLHAATVGDIPGPGYLRNGRRAASREELASNTSSRIQPQVKTLSRSFSVLAPWKPRHPRETMEVDYTQYPKPNKNSKYEQKVIKNSSRKDNSSTLKKKAQETKKYNNSTLTRRSKSKENVSSNLRRSKEELSRGSTSTLYKKKDRLPRENSRYSKDEKKISSKSLSVESLGGSNERNGRRSREESRDISRSLSMPRDPEKSAGWFKLSRKSKHSGSTQRL